MKKETDSVLAQNRKARHDYFIEETYEAGLELTGTEVKSIRQGRANLKDSYALIRNGQAYIVGVHVSPYEQGNIFNVDPVRDRRLLLHKREIRKLAEYSQQQGCTLVPLKLYLVRGRVKLELAVARGKKLYDKRDDIASRDAQRRIERAFAGKRDAE